MTAALALLLLLQAEAERPPGQRFELGEGATLFVPRDFAPSGHVVPVVLHLHGSPPIAERALATAGWPAVLIVLNRKGLSRVYEEPFRDPELLPRLLDGAMAAIKAAKIDPEPRTGPLLVSSFSAGFGGVRALLQQSEGFDRIDALVLADSLYAGYSRDDPALGIAPAKIAMFERFAIEAAAGRKTLVLTHSAQVPEGYASTTETADALLRAVRAESPHPLAVPEGEWAPTRTVRIGRLLVRGYPGRGPEDHMRHLRQLGDIWRAVPQPWPPKP